MSQKAAYTDLFVSQSLWGLAYQPEPPTARDITDEVVSQSS